MTRYSVLPTRSLTTRAHSRQPNTRPAPRTWALTDGRSNSFHAFGHAEIQQSTATPQDFANEVVYDPHVWIASNQNANEMALKKQRVDGTHAEAATPPLLTPPMSYPIAPSTSFTALNSNLLVPSGLDASNYSISSCSTDSSSFRNGEDMTRQGSTASSMSMIEGLNMMRVESTSSADFGACFPSLFGEQQDGSFLSDSVTSGVTEKLASSSQATTASDDSRLQQNDMFKNMGGGFASTDFPSVSFDFSSSVDLDGTGMPWQGQTLHSVGVIQRADSQDSTATTSSASSTDAQLKATKRLSKHIANAATQSLLPKSSPAATSKPAPKAITSQKLAISRLPPNVKARDPLQCSRCDKTLRGPHELARHWENIHARVKTVWVCVQPTSSPIMPKKPLNTCKQCQQQKRYNADYNAAAHLKRGHFRPSKRGRRRSADVQLQPKLPVNKDPGPPIELLKKYGWLKEISVMNDGDLAVAEDEEDNDVMNDKTNDKTTHNATQHANGNMGLPGFHPQLPQSGTGLPGNFTGRSTASPPIDAQQVGFCTSVLGLQPPDLQGADGDFSMIETIGEVWPVAPAMEHSYSAPGRFGR